VINVADPAAGFHTTLTEFNETTFRVNISQVLSSIYQVKLSEIQIVEAVCKCCSVGRIKYDSASQSSLANSKPSSGSVASSNSLGSSESLDSRQIVPTDVAPRSCQAQVSYVYRILRPSHQSRDNANARFLSDEELVRELESRGFDVTRADADGDGTCSDGTVCGSGFESKSSNTVHRPENQTVIDSNKPSIAHNFSAMFAVVGTIFFGFTITFGFFRYIRYSQRHVHLASGVIKHKGKRQPDQALVCTLDENNQDCFIPFDDIRLGDMLSMGTEGAVFDGTYNFTKVAIKVVMMSCTQYDQGLAVVQREASVWKQLNHPNVVKFYGVSQNFSKLYLVMEKMQCSVEQILQPNLKSHTGHMRSYASAQVDGGGKNAFVSLSEPSFVDALAARRIKWLQQIASGMSYLHSKSVIHRDLKPANILVDMLEDDVKIADFGASCFRNDSKMMTACVGTPAFMAPELMSEDLNAAYTDSVDVFAFGLCMWAILHQTMPYSERKFEGLNTFGLISRISEGLRPPIASTCPIPLRSLIIKCWGHDPECRPEFTAICEALELFSQQSEMNSAAIANDHASPKSGCDLPSKRTESHTVAVHQSCPQAFGFSEKDKASLDYQKGADFAMTNPLHRSTDADGLNCPIITL